MDYQTKTNDRINNNMNTIIELDGSTGEGGGQILRTALSLSMVTRKPFVINNIRAKRPKPGLLRQHLTAVTAAATVCGAEIQGATLGSTSLAFTPSKVKAGDYTFSIGSAGSCTLVFQTVLPALILADAPSRVVFEGGTHNGMAPPFQFIERAFLPLLARMGVRVDVVLERYGFYPAGGGRFVATIRPTKSLTPITLLTRGAQLDAYAEAVVAAVPGHVARREVDVIAEALHWQKGDAARIRIQQLPDNQGPGNVAMTTIAHEHVTEVFTAFGEKGLSAEIVATRVVDETRAYLASDAAVSEHLADQLMLPLAIAGGGSFTATAASEHARTNAMVIGKFLPLKIDIVANNIGSVIFVFSKT
jgi:RNA 3'-terminal phosphate cyclase (ATP)